MGKSRKHSAVRGFTALLLSLLPSLSFKGSPALGDAESLISTPASSTIPSMNQETPPLVPPFSPAYPDQSDLIAAYESAWSLWDQAVQQEALLRDNLASALLLKEEAALKRDSAQKLLDDLLESSRYRAAASYVFSPSSQSSPLAASSPSDAVLSSMVRGDSDKYVSLSDGLTEATRIYADSQNAFLQAQQLHAGSVADLDLRKAYLDQTKSRLLIFQESIALASDGCPLSAPEGTLSPAAQLVGIYQLCIDSVLQAPSKEAASAIKYALSQLGSPYTKVGRMQPGMFDCSSLVMRSYEAAGAQTVSRGGRGWAPTTWVIRQAPWAVTVSDAEALPGDLVFPAPGHVSMLLAHGQMVHTSTTSKPARVQDAYRTTYVIRRVLPWYLQDPLSEIPNPWTTWSPPSDLSQPVAAPSDDPTADYIEPLVEPLTEVLPAFDAVTPSPGPLDDRS